MKKLFDVYFFFFSLHCRLINSTIPDIGGEEKKCLCDYCLS